MAKRRVPRGKALPRDENTLEIISAVTPADRVAAREDWIDKTSPAYRGLVDATLEPEEEG
jgi:hypothetical protein